MGGDRDSVGGIRSMAMTQQCGIGSWQRGVWATCAAGALAGALAWVEPVAGDSVILNPCKDNTLIQNTQGEVSNGAGEGIFSGRTGTFGGQLRQRAALSFNLSIIPPGST